MGHNIAYVFPGQGSQSVGMLDAWFDHILVRDTIAEASDALATDLWQLMHDGPAASLNSTVNTQPAIVASSVAIYRAWQAVFRGAPAVAAGHSVGEISALAAAGALSLADAVRLVRARAQAMTDAVPNAVGGMAAVIGLDDETVRRLCAECAQGRVLEPVNYNASGQVVVAGHVDAIERLKEKAKSEGAKMVFILPVSGPFHSSLMRPALEQVARHVQSLRFCAPVFPILHNATVDTAALNMIPSALCEQLVRPVRWTETVRKFADRGVTQIVEIGSGEVLTNLCRRISPDVVVWPVNSPAAMEQAANRILQ